MRFPHLSLSVVALAWLLATAGSACAGNGALLGTYVGAGLGGLFGNQYGHGNTRMIATGAGIVAGGFIGNSVGRLIDVSEVSPPNAGYHQPTIYSSAPPPGYRTYAPNYVAPPAPAPIYAPIYIDQEARTYCRTYSQNIRVAGRVHEQYGTTCLQPDGRWLIVR